MVLDILIVDFSLTVQQTNHPPLATACSLCKKKKKKELEIKYFINFNLIIIITL